MQVCALAELFGGYAIQFHQSTVHGVEAGSCVHCNQAVDKPELRVQAALSRIALNGSPLPTAADNVARTSICKCVLSIISRQVTSFVWPQRSAIDREGRKTPSWKTCAIGQSLNRFLPLHHFFIRHTGQRDDNCRCTRSVMITLSIGKFSDGTGHKCHSIRVVCF